MKISDYKQFSGEIITAGEILLKFLENKSISQFFEKLLMFCGSIKTYAKCIVANEPLVIKLHYCTNIYFPGMILFQIYPDFRILAIKFISCF